MLSSVSSHQVKQKASAVVASNVECKRLANKAFTSYLRSVSLMPLKEVFDVKALPIDDFAESLGLLKAPSLKFLKTTTDREEVREKKNKNKALERLKEKIKMERAAKQGLPVEVKKGGRIAAGSDSEDSSDEEEDSGSEAEEDGDEAPGGLLRVKRKHEWDEGEEKEEETQLPLKPKKAKPLKIKLGEDAKRANKKIKFSGSDDEENEEEDGEDGSGSEGEEDEEDGVMALDDMDAVREQNESFVRKIQERLKASKGTYLIHMLSLLSSRVFIVAVRVRYDYVLVTVLHERAV